MGRTGLDPTYVAELQQLAAQLASAGHGGKTELVKAFAARHGKSMQSIYRHVDQALGRPSGRRRRADAGTSRQAAEDVALLSAMMHATTRQNGKRVMGVSTACDILQANGRPIALSPSQMRAQVRRQAVALSAGAADTHTHLRSAHPNHVHLVDPSLCLLYYAPDGTQRVVRDDEVYKNKPDKAARLNDLRVWRYVLVDHYSATIAVRYYAAAGETQASLWEFLLWCWARHERCPFHGVPKILMADKGSANASWSIAHALAALDVKLLTHAPGNPRAKGAVEIGNNIVECSFESRLRLEPVRNVDELNARAEDWQFAYNAAAFDYQDTRLKRPGMTPSSRYGLWQRIRENELRILPPIEHCHPLLRTRPQTRQVRADMTISFVHPTSRAPRVYDLRLLRDLRPRAEVEVTPLVMGGEDVLIGYDDLAGERQELRCSPVAIDPISGFRLDAALIGEEYRAAPDNAATRSAKALDRLAYPGVAHEDMRKTKRSGATPFSGTLDAHSYLGTLAGPEYMRRRGTEMATPDHARVEIAPVSHVAAAKRLVQLVGRALTKAEFAGLQHDYPDGVPEDAIPALAERFTGRRGDPIEHTA